MRFNLPNDKRIYIPILYFINNLYCKMEGFINPFVRAFRYDMSYFELCFMHSQGGFIKSILSYTFYFAAWNVMIIFVDKYCILDYGAERFDERKARGAFADSARLG